MTGGPTWIEWCWWIGGYVVALAGLALLLWAMFADRSRGRRRCPKCWYDMSAAPAPGLRCSECGHESKGERKLFKTRRRWRWAWAAMFIMVVGYGVSLQPKIQRDGFMASVPNTILICGLAWCDGGDAETGWRKMIVDEFRDKRMRLYGPSNVPDMPLWEWQWRLLATVAMRNARPSESPMLPPQQLITASDNVHGWMLKEMLQHGVIHRLGYVDDMVRQFPVRIVVPASGRGLGQREPHPPPGTVMQWPAGQILYVKYDVESTLPISIVFDFHPVDCTTSTGEEVPICEAERYSNAHYHISTDALAIDVCKLSGRQRLLITGDVTVMPEGTLDFSQRLPFGSISTTLDVVLDGEPDQFVVPIQADLNIGSMIQWPLKLKEDGLITIEVQYNELNGIEIEGFSPRLELWRDDRLITSAVSYPSGLGSDYVQLELPSDLRPTSDETENWVLRVRGDPTRALRESSGASYWSGGSDFLLRWKQVNGQLQVEPVGSEQMQRKIAE